MTHTAYISLGTNLGDRPGNLRTAVSTLSKSLEVRRLSPVYETPPWGYQDQPPFLNQVLEAGTSLPPLELLAYLKGVEKQMGRVETVRNGPRLIDLDIIFYDDLVLDAPGLVLPHPRLEGRGFVLLPLADLAADFRHPASGETVRQMCAKADLSGIELYEG